MELPSYVYSNEQLIYYRVLPIVVVLLTYELEIVIYCLRHSIFSNTCHISKAIFQKQTLYNATVAALPTYIPSLAAARSMT